MCDEILSKKETNSSGNATNSSELNKAGNSVSSLMNNCHSPLVPLQTLRVIAYGPNGHKNIRCILDGGNQRSYIREEVAHELGLVEVGTETYSHELFGGKQTRSFKYSNVKIIVSDINGYDKCEFEVSVKDCISSYIDIPTAGPWTTVFAKKGIKFTDLKSNSETVDLLIGNKLIHKVLTGRKITLDYGPGAIETRWGWVLSGEIPVDSRRMTSSLLVTSLHVVDRPISDLWALETLGIMDSASTQSKRELEDAAFHHFKENVARLDNGRYEVKLPFFQGAQQTLPDNRMVAERRLLQATKGLKANGYLQKYHDVFQQWIKEEMIELIPPEEETKSCHYLPHRAVIKLSSETTPVRPVFDASCKLKGKPSLNDCVEVGPNLLELIPKLINRFRLHRVGITSDIRKAFQQISIAPTHRDFLRFLWWEDINCKRLTKFRHKRVVFGVSCSPFLLGATLQHHLEQCSSIHSDIAVAVKKSLYVDNCVLSVSNSEEAQQFKFKSTELLNSAHFELRSWEIGPQLFNSEESLKSEESYSEKFVPVLGLLWNKRQDYLTIDTTSALSCVGENYTQRKLLSLAHMLFDPMGWLSPFTLQAKLLIRECHRLKLGWDKDLPDDLQKETKKWALQISHIPQVQITRYTGLDDATSVTIHAFGDASNSAYAAAVFLRLQLQDKVLVQLLESKAKVPPIKNITIPRLELLSCLITARLAASVALSMEEGDIPIFYWTDSATSLAWITGDGPWAIFVHNRVEEIKRISQITAWRHIPGKSNPADLPSRGCSISKLVQSRWWEGPDWLFLSEDKWPVSSSFPDDHEVTQEMKKVVISMLTSPNYNPLFKLLKWSSYDGILRIIAYIRRFVHNLHEKSNGRGKSISSAITVPSKDELEQAEKNLFRLIQKDLKNKIQDYKNLRPYIDEDGVLRVKSRLTHEDEDLFINPVLLPNKNPFVNLLIFQVHVQSKHGGTQFVLSSLREKYWIVNGRRTVRAIVKSCAHCRLFSATRLVVDQAPLPTVRTATAAPFYTTGIDMAGPLLLKGGAKVWVALFTCAVYRGVHLEVVDTMSTDGFLSAFRRFTSRRGRPEIVYSDNGLNFTGAARVFRNIDWGKVQEYATTTRITWRFNPPSAPWWGGWWERLIGLLKQLLRRNLGKQTVNLVELSTLLCELENVLNGRPLTYQSEDPADNVPLTPNHFLRNAALSYLPELDVKDGKSLKKAQKKLQVLREQLRSRFRREYLGQLLHVAHIKSNQLKPDDVVLIETENHKRVEWPLGVVTETIPGRDGIIRTYRVRTKGGIITRPAQRLFPLEIKE